MGIRAVDTTSSLLAAHGWHPLPLLPSKILILNLVTDVFPSLALGASLAPLLVDQLAACLRTAEGGS